MNENRPDFEQLMRQFSDGSEKAAHRIIEQYSGNILRAIRRHLPTEIRSKLDSVDIFQSVWFSVLKNPKRLADFESPNRLVAYLVGTSRFKVLEKYRHYTKMQAFNVRREMGFSDHIETEGLASTSTTQAKELIVEEKLMPASAVAEAREAWSNLISSCDERDHKILELRLSGMTNEEIAEQMNISSRTVCRSLDKMLATFSQ